MAERKAVNKYYPPDWDPSKGSVNKHVGQHPLRERAKKLSQGILVIRFEMPYNIWCNGCGNHIGMGVRYNAEKKKVGNYYTTPIYRFRMKCHLCDNYMEIETDPKNCDYTIVSGARRKEERWDPSATENIEATDHAEKQKLIDDAMYKLEHGEKDKKKSKAAIPGLVQIKDIQSQWKDDFALNQMLRKKFRHEKKVISDKEEKDKEIKVKGSLDIDLVNEDPEDVQLAGKIRFHSDGFEGHQRKRRLQIKMRPMFAGQGESPKNIKRSELLEKRQRIELIHHAGLTRSSAKTDENIVVRKMKSKDSSTLVGDKEQSSEANHIIVGAELDSVVSEEVDNDKDLSGNSKLLQGNERVSSLYITDIQTTVVGNVSSTSTELETKRTNELKRTIQLPEQDINVMLQTRQRISLVSQDYSDTDSDNSK